MFFISDGCECPSEGVFFWINLWTPFESARQLVPDRVAEMRRHHSSEVREANDTILKKNQI